MLLSKASYLAQLSNFMREARIDLQNKSDRKENGSPPKLNEAAASKLQQTLEVKKNVWFTFKKKMHLKFTLILIYILNDTKEHIEVGGQKAIV